MPAAARACPACHTPLPIEAHFCLHCGTPTPTEPGVPARTAPTGAVEISRVQAALMGSYRVERVLGEGGMATVYLAEDVKHKRKVAVKVMRPELAETLGTERFLREVEIAAQLSHPSILPVFDSGSTNGVLWYVMPYVEGESLPAWIRRERQLAVGDAVRLAREVAEALAYAHERGIVHRDIKPANILLHSGRALVSDFGIARAAGTDGASLTKTGLAIGTPQYMSPEQSSGDRDVDGRADVYALGCVLYEMIAGEPPFTGPTMQAVVARSLTERPRPLTATREGLPSKLNTVVERALAKSPADRYPSATAMAGALAGVEAQLHGGSGEITPLAPPSTGRVWLAFGIAALLALTTLVVLAVRKGLPPWVVGLAGVLIGGGALALTLTARAERRRQDGATSGRFDRWLNWRNAALGGIAALAIWAMMATAFAVGGSTPGGTDSKRLAILPFENQGKADDAYLADGIVDEVRGKLTKLGQLSVIASTSTSQYRGTSKTPQQIARELGVGYLLVGKVRWEGAAGAGRKVQVVAELVDGGTGATTWQQVFDADVTDVFSMQTAMATRVAGALGAALGSNDQQQLATRPTANAAAYDLYLKGRAITNNSAGAQREAAGYYEQAVALDSTFGDAWAWLTVVLTRVYSNGTRDPAVARRAHEAMEHALRAGGTNAISHVAAASYFALIAGDLAGAHREMDVALATAPNDADVQARAANLDMQSGQFESALVKLTHARELDPRSTTTLSTLLTALVYLQRFPEAQAVAQEATSLAPQDPNLLEYAVLAHVGAGDLPGAQAVLRAAIASGSATDLVAYFAGYNELAWVLDEPQQQLLFRLTPAAFDNDRAWWSQSLSIAAMQRRETVRQRAYADSSLAPSAAQSAANPADPQLRVLYGVMLAYAGKTADAVREADSVQTMIAGKPLDASNLYYRVQLARIYLATGATDKALGLLEELLREHYVITPGRLRLDPSFASLRGNPRFQKLIAATAAR
ncbi:MAG TPA: protein kinase [Gemmatimonadales bacterium]